MGSPGYLADVAIIGAGLGGCALALALSQRGIPVTVFESRPLESDVWSSGVIITPNGATVLDRLGVLPRIEGRCFKPTHRIFKNAKYETLRKTVVADEKMYGYRSHRVWRRILLDEMRTMLNERSVPVHYGSKFGKIVNDGVNGVTFTIGDVPRRASILIGVDGIWSSVRQHIEPDIVPEYTGLLGILTHIKTASVSWPAEGFEPNCTIQGKPGAIFYLPEDPQIDEIMIGVQVNHPEMSRAEIDELRLDSDKLVAFFTKGYEDWGPTARSIIDSVVASKERCYMWPFVRIPRLQRWYSESGRVIILGDAAHGLPPSSGQGINSALEDVFALNLLLTADSSTPTNGSGSPDFDSAQLLQRLGYWQNLRQTKIDAVLDWTTNSNNANRLPEEERRRLIAQGKFKEGQGEDMSWLYQSRIEQDVSGYLSRPSQAA